MAQRYTESTYKELLHKEYYGTLYPFIIIVYEVAMGMLPPSYAVNAKSDAAITAIPKKRQPDTSFPFGSYLYAVGSSSANEM